MAGEFPCGRLFRAAVARQRADVERAGSEGFPFVFDAEAGARVARFCELLPHVEGPLAGECVTLEPWQVWAIVVSHGWFTVEEPRRPRFRRIVLFLPKGNGKTFLAAALALFVLALGGKGEKVVSAATTRDQARLSFDTARNMLIRAPRVRDHFGLLVGQHAITQPATGGVYKPLSAEANSLEGLIPSYVLLDEIHAHRTRDVYDNLRSAAAKRPDTRTVIISTSGFDTDGIGYEVYTYARQILEAEVRDESQFALLIEADTGADPWDPATWRMANPNLGVSIDPVETASEANEARHVTSKRVSFFAKRLGWWSSGRSAFFDLERWDSLADHGLTLDQFRHDPCFLGLDLASSRAFACLAAVFYRDLPHRNPERAATNERERHFYVFVESFLHERAVRDNDAFTSWAADRQITVTPGETTDYGFILRRIRALLDGWKVAEIVSDPYEAKQLMQLLGELRVPFVEWPQRVPNLSPPMKDLAAAILDGRIHHPGNRALRWMVGNVTAKLDANENVFPRKERADLYIDGVSAALNALGRIAIAKPPAASNPYMKRGLLFL